MTPIATLRTQNRVRTGARAPGYVSMFRAAARRASSHTITEMVHVLQLRVHTSRNVHPVSGVCIRLLRMSTSRGTCCGSENAQTSDDGQHGT
jgi:hypothetical protein